MREKDIARRAFIFDLDGTLVNSYEQIANALNSTRSNSGFSKLENDDIYRKIGLPIDALIEDLHLPPADKEAFIRDFRVILSKEIERGNLLFPGVKEFVESAIRRDIRLGIATSKPSRLALQVIHNSDINGQFQYIQGTDGFCSKPDPEVIVRCLAGLECKKALMFGDRAEDMEAAVRAKIFGVGIAQSFHSRRELFDAGAKVVYESFVKAQENFEEILLLLQVGGELSQP